MLIVMDLSQHNGVVDWGKVSGVSAVILRCGIRGYGTGNIVADSRFAANAMGARSRSIPFGVYFFSQAISVAEAQQEADYAVSCAKAQGATMPIYIDSEYGNGGKGRADKLPKAVRTECLNAFCARVRSLGYTPGIYASESWYKDFLNQPDLDSAAVRWVARYGSAPGIKYNGVQYTDAGSCPGVSGKVDLSKFDGLHEKEDEEMVKTTVTVGSAKVEGVLIGNVTYVPLRDFMDKLQAQIAVNWDAKTGASVDLK